MDPRKVRKIWQLIFDAFWFIQDLFTINQWQIIFWLSSSATLSCPWPPRDPPPSQGLSWPSFTMSEGLQVVSQSLGRALIDLDDPGWTWEDEYLLTSNALWASPSAAEKTLCTRTRTWNPNFLVKPDLTSKSPTRHGLILGCFFLHCASLRIPGCFFLDCPSAEIVLQFPVNFPWHRETQMKVSQGHQEHDNDDDDDDEKIGQFTNMRQKHIVGTSILG